ncbi:MAG TPA: hypothetical protein VIC57_07675 [Candidatus Dormibacteraeota bacterium]
MRVELTGAERARLRGLIERLSTNGASGALVAAPHGRSRVAQDAIARAHGLHPGDARFCADPASGAVWIEVRPPREDPGRTALADHFLRAIDDFAVGDLDLEVEPPALARLSAKVDAGGPILVGERHGVEQNPLVAYTLMRRFGLRVLALEWAADLRPVIDRFLAEGALDVARLADSADGRITAGHFAVLRALRRDGALDRVVLFDPVPWPGTWSERDRGMAAHVLQETGQATALVMAGSLHTRLRRHRHGEPMGAHLAHARSGAVEVRLRYPGETPPTGRAGVCLLRSAGAWLELTVPDARQALTPAG